MLALGARDLARHPERRAPRLVVLALRVPPVALAERLAAAIGGEDPSRVLVLTDSLDFATLRGLGVGFELLELPDGRLHERSIERIRERAALLLRGRKPLRVRSIGLLGPELLGDGEGTTS